MAEANQTDKGSEEQNEKLARIDEELEDWRRKRPDEWERMTRDCMIELKLKVYDDSGWNIKRYTHPGMVLCKRVIARGDETEAEEIVEAVKEIWDSPKVREKP